MPNEDTLAVVNAEPEPDPLVEVDYTGDLETDARAELNAIQQGFRDRAKREEERFRLATDSEYWAMLCFKTRADKEKFLTRAKLLAVEGKSTSTATPQPAYSASRWTTTKTTDGEEEPAMRNAFRRLSRAVARRLSRRSVGGDRGRTSGT